MTLRVYLSPLVLNVFFQAGRTAPATKEAADEIVIVKSEPKMTLLNQGKTIHEYQVALSTVPVGAKERNGDHKVPEGEYRLITKTRQASFISRCTSPIRTLRIRPARRSWGLTQAEKSRFMD